MQEGTSALISMCLGGAGLVREPEPGKIQWRPDQGSGVMDLKKIYRDRKKGEYPEHTNGFIGMVSCHGSSGKVCS